MRVLVVTRNAWDDTNAIGNTLSNFFKGIDCIEFANIYFRAAKPNNKLCKTYFHVTEIEILKKHANKNKLLISGGSDYHGENKNNIKIGQLNNTNQPIDFTDLNILNII